MADKSLGRIFFPIFRKTSGDTGRSVQDPIGVFSCNLNAARFLDLDELAIPLPVMVRERKAGRRSITLADGTKLTPTAAGADVSSSEIVIPVSGRGSRTVILLTGKQITDTARVKNKANAFHTISFRFPSFLNILGISEALGEIIPGTKIKNPPTAADIWGHFTVKGGRRYPIMLATAAETSVDYDVPETESEINALMTQAGIKKIRKAAGGDP
jgi:hypothetical protein